MMAATFFKCLSAILFGLFGSWSDATTQYGLTVYFMVQSLLCLGIHWFDSPYFMSWMNLLIHGCGFITALAMALEMNAGSGGDIIVRVLSLVGSILLVIKLIFLFRFLMNPNVHASSVIVVKEEVC
jgi:hypothetical protein